ncbi:MAG: DUF1206 domain-containing protein [Mobilicoccus sp.]|nr:DUF1206 domain-containing protein [Mobilicoccus sp.]
MTSDARRAAAGAGRQARRLADHPVLEKLARFGFVGNGVLHLLIAVIALRVAFGGAQGEQADQSGALAMLRDAPGGSIMLWLMVIGVGALGVWLITQAVLPAFGTDAKERAKLGAKGVIYLAITVAAVGIARGTSGEESSSEDAQSATATLMAAPGGQLLVGLVGVGILGFGVYYAYRGWARKFVENLEAHPGEWPVRMGVAGYIAKGFALAIVGLLFIVAAATLDPEKSQGLDGAMTSLRDQPFGAFLLALVALGLAAFGLWCFFRARHEDL